MSPDTFYVRGRNQYKRQRLSPRSKVARSQNSVHSNLETVLGEATPGEAIVRTKRVFQASYLVSKKLDSRGSSPCLT